LFKTFLGKNLTCRAAIGAGFKPTLSVKKMFTFDRFNFELFAGFSAIGGATALMLCISSVNSAALDRYVQRVDFRDCMIEKSEAVCTAAHPLGAIK